MSNSDAIATREFAAGSTTVADLAPSPVKAVRSSSGSGRLHICGTEISVEDEIGKAFITECSRNIEGLRSDREIKEAWDLDDGEWIALAENKPLLNAIKIEREKRIRNGEAAREAAQLYFAKAPAVLNEILQNATVSPRHRIEAAKELRQVAADVREHTASGEKFSIVIDLGGDCQLVREFEQPARLRSDDGDEQ
jgi:hypothetical protein